MRMPAMVLPTIDGRLEEAVAAADRLVRLGDELGYATAARQFAVGTGSTARLLLGDAEGALALLNELATMSETAVMRARRAELLAALGRTAEAAAELLRGP